MKPYYKDDYCEIWHGDCREILPTLPKCDLLLTDPPYGVGEQYISHDDSSAGYGTFIQESFRLMLDSAPVLLLTPGIRNVFLYPKPKWILAWFKPGSTSRNDTGGFNEWEPVLVYGKQKFQNDVKRLLDCANHSKETGCHPCPKPLRLFTWLINQTDAQTILDPFMGSGTTLRAAKDLQRKSIGIEIEEKYCEIAAKRLAQEVLAFKRKTKVAHYQILITAVSPETLSFIRKVRNQRSEYAHVAAPELCETDDPLEQPKVKLG
jgi:site-specific DNA-methyltransferase (adenine-specific)